MTKKEETFLYALFSEALMNDFKSFDPNEVEVITYLL